MPPRGGKKRNPESSQIVYINSGWGGLNDPRGWLVKVHRAARHLYEQYEIVVVMNLLKKWRLYRSKLIIATQDRIRKLRTDLMKETGVYIRRRNRIEGLAIGTGDCGKRYHHVAKPEQKKG